MKKEIAVNITQQALDKAKELVSLDSSSIGLRIEIKKGGCSGMTYDVVHAKSLFFHQKYYQSLYYPH